MKIAITGGAGIVGRHLDERFVAAHVVMVSRRTGVNIDGTRAVVEAARRAGVERIVMLSFLRARPDCGSRYHESKWADEELVRGSGLNSRSSRQA